MFLSSKTSKCAPRAYPLEGRKRTTPPINHINKKMEKKNKGGRPRLQTGKVKRRTVSTRLTEAEYLILRHRAQMAGRKLSHYQHDALLSGQVVAARTQEDRRQIRMLENGCNNLNQLARLAHRNGLASVAADLQKLLSKFNLILSNL